MACGNGNPDIIIKLEDQMKHDVASMSNADVGKAFNAIAKGIGHNDLGEILFNWNESQLNEEGDKIVGYPGRDGVYSRGKEGGKVNVSKREFLDWLVSDKPFDEKVYGANIRNDAHWTGLIQRARVTVSNKILIKGLFIIPTLDQSIERMKQEILADIKSGRVPADCPSFSALHDYVDANCYGGFCEDDLLQALVEHFGGRDENEGMPDDLMDYLNTAQNEIDAWLRTLLVKNQHP